MIGMEGYYLAEQHSYRPGQQVNAEDDKDDEVPDESSWVMLRDGNIQKLPQENLELRVRGRVSFEMTPTDGGKREEALPPKSSNGTLYLSNLRIIYLPAKPSEAFKSFAAPILKVGDSFVNSQTFGPWYWKATVEAVQGGGIPSCYPRIDIKLVFYDGDHNRWANLFTQIKESLHHAQDSGAQFGMHAPLDPLPQYEPPSPSPGPSQHAAENTQPAPQPVVPEEPPPGYEEAQAQAVSESLNRALRGDAGREASG